MNLYLSTLNGKNIAAKEVLNETLTARNTSLK